MRNKKLFALTATCMLSTMLLFGGCGSSNTNTADSSDSSDATVSSDASTDATESSVVDGTYTASATGMESDVTVTITVTDGVISDCSIDASGETETIGGLVPDKIESVIVENNGENVDAVSGATITSNAALEALADCMAQAGMAQ